MNCRGRTLGKDTASGRKRPTGRSSGTMREAVELLWTGQPRAAVPTLVSYELPPAYLRRNKQNGPQVKTCGPSGGLFGIDQEVVTLRGLSRQLPGLGPAQGRRPEDESLRAT